MTPEVFHDHNVVYAKDQPEYQPLPAYVDGRTCVTCWRLTWWERIKLLLTGRLWLQQLYFGDPLQPQLPTVDNPVEDVQLMMAADLALENATPDPTIDGDYTEDAGQEPRDAK